MGREGYTSAEAAALCGLTPPHIRALARAGVVGGKQSSAQGRAPWRFSFRDVRVLRSAAGLLGSAGLKQVTMRRTLQALKGQVAHRALPLSGAHLVAQEGRIFARDGQSMWDTTSGQTLMWYEDSARGAAGLAHVTKAPPPPPKQVVSLPHSGGTKRADEHFVAALAIEAADPVAAYNAYLAALACDPTHVEATINIGHICFAFRELERAVGYFTLATQLDPVHAVAQFNLAVALHDLGRFKEAEVAYRHALVLDPDNQDAQVNLQLLLSDDGLA